MFEDLNRISGNVNNDDWHPTTLADYRDIALVLSGDENSGAVKFFDDKIAKQGPNERVIAAESQMIYLILSMISNTGDGGEAVV